MVRSSSGAREKVLKAAESIASEVGGHGLTLDAVAERAGVSKGGLLYHFPSKDALLEGLLDACASEHFGQIHEQRRLQPDLPLAAAYLRASMNDQPSTDPLFAGIASALFQNKALLSSWECLHRKFFDQLAVESDDFALDAILSFAADGLWLSESYGMTALQPAQRAQVVARLAALASRPRRENAA